MVPGLLAFLVLTVWLNRATVNRILVLKEGIHVHAWDEDGGKAIFKEQTMYL